MKTPAKRAIKRHGVIAMAGKPVHAGHIALINLAASQNDSVTVFVSLNDRIKKGEFPIYGSDMSNIWRDQIERILPTNVKPVYCTSSPVTEAYSFIGNANPSEHDIKIYGDPHDVCANFPDASLKKYAQDLYTAGRLARIEVPRSTTVPVSGTQMRQYLMNGNRFDFVSNLPKDVDGDLIWNMLRLRR